MLVVRFYGVPHTSEWLGGGAAKPDTRRSQGGFDFG
jgi:hypothetical protein